MNRLLFALRKGICLLQIKLRPRGAILAVNADEIRVIRTKRGKA
jgi:hypothetical protein